MFCSDVDKVHLTFGSVKVTLSLMTIVVLSFLDDGDDFLVVFNPGDKGCSRLFSKLPVCIIPGKLKYKPNVSNK